jgi:two-component system, response regulator PdtaR
MTLTLLPAIRGRQCAIFSSDSRMAGALLRQLELLDVGGTINPQVNDAEPAFCFVDVDTAVEEKTVLPSRFTQIPMIAVIGTETPGHLEWILPHRPASLLMKPVSSQGIYAAVVVALAEARRREQDFLKLLKLEERVRARRIVVAAIIKLMKHYAIEEPEAFVMLRNAAQQRRTSIEGLCAEVIGNNYLPVRLATKR